MTLQYYYQIQNLRQKALALQWDMAHWNLVHQARLLEAALQRHEAEKAGYKPDQPRVPAGNPDGGQWTRVGGSGDAEPIRELGEYEYISRDVDGNERIIYDPPIEPIYPVETILSLLTVGEVLTVVNTIRLSRQAASLAAKKLENAIHTIEDYLGGVGKTTSNKYGDIVIMRDGKKIRFDIRNFDQDKPHFHIQRQAPNGKWKDAGKQHRYYFKDE